MYIDTGAVFFHVFLKFKRGMPTVSSMTTPLRVCMLQIYSAVTLVLAINSLKMKQMVDFFLFCSSVKDSKKAIRHCSRTRNYSEMDIPSFERARHLFWNELPGWLRLLGWRFWATGGPNCKIIIRCHFYDKCLTLVEFVVSSIFLFFMQSYLPSTKV